MMVYLHAWTQWVDLRDQVVMRSPNPVEHAAPEAWAMENPRQNGPCLVEND